MWYIVQNEGTRICISGPSGCGKSVISEAIAYECGRPMKLLSCAELWGLHRTSLTQKTNQSDKIFSDLNSGLSEPMKKT